MKASKLIITTSLVSAIAVMSISQAAFAWHPKGVIIKEVQNMTTGSAMSDANTVATAVAAKPGDIIKYTINVRNDAAAADHNDNDMTSTVMTDTLPAGVELVSNPSQRQIVENIGTIVPGKTVTKEYTLKVTASTATTITNEACFTGNTLANDNPQQGCDKAVVTVTVPTPPVVTPPVVTPPVITPTTPEAPVELPHTGIASTLFGSVVALGAVTYAVSAYLRSRAFAATRNNG